jgi:DNA mismatch repair ATPase MutS
VRVAGPLAVVGAIVAEASGAPPPGAVLGLALLGNLVASGVVARRVGRELAPLGEAHALLAPLRRLLARYGDAPVHAPAWQALQPALRDGGAALARLVSLAGWGAVRHSPLLHVVLNATLAWDAQLAARLTGWRRAHGAAAARWIDALAEAEALVALGTLAHDHPDWAFPEVVDDAADAMLEATGLAHPLLDAATRVGNPAELGGPGRVLVISGANMAGKTTYLRAIGVNALLALAGAPVCARAMRVRRVRVATSIGIRDALGEGVSLFLAELRRLQAIVAAAAEPEAPPVLYLLDEVLHGTNSRDRRTATRAVLAHLRRHGAVGVVTTHDLELADDPALAAGAAHLHFQEGWAPAGADGGAPRMTFDYVARAGRATGSNALALLAALGLDAPEAAPGAGLAGDLPR